MAASSASFLAASFESTNIDKKSRCSVSSLLDAANIVDELFSDNLYRMMTHDSIKNMDSTYSREVDQDALDDIIVGGTKVQKLLRLYGRSFDDLKDYIEGISFANTVSYDALNNLPNQGTFSGKEVGYASSFNPISSPIFSYLPLI